MSGVEHADDCQGFPAACVYPNVRRSVAAATIALGLLWGAGAAAHAHIPTVAPPGNSATGEYVEDIPSANGSVPVPNAHGFQAQPGVLSHAVARKLDAFGRNGRRTALVAEATAPTGRASRSSSALAAKLLRGPSGSAIGTLATSLTSGNGLLPLVLLLSALLAVALALRGRGRRQ
jgi:hypothetical protein